MVTRRARMSRQGVNSTDTTFRKTKARPVEIPHVEVDLDVDFVVVAANLALDIRRKKHTDPTRNLQEILYANHLPSKLSSQTSHYHHGKFIFNSRIPKQTKTTTTTTTTTTAPDLVHGPARYRVGIFVCCEQCPLCSCLGDCISIGTTW